MEILQIVYLLLLPAVLLIALISGKSPKPITPLVMIMFIGLPLFIVIVNYPTYMLYVYGSMVLALVGGLLSRFCPDVPPSKK